MFVETVRLPAVTLILGSLHREILRTNATTRLAHCTRARDIKRQRIAVPVCIFHVCARIRAWCAETWRQRTLRKSVSTFPWHAFQPQATALSGTAAGIREMHA